MPQRLEGRCRIILKPVELSEMRRRDQWKTHQNISTAHIVKSVQKLQRGLQHHVNGGRGHESGVHVSKRGPVRASLRRRDLERVFAQCKQKREDGPPSKARQTAGNGSPLTIHHC